MINVCSPQEFINFQKESTYPHTFNFFEGTDCLDSKQCYESILSNAAPDWHYRLNPITYTVNSQRYRCDDFSKIDWNNSIVIFGCSFVFGVGVDDADTLSNKLSNQLGLNVINLGVNGASQHFNLYNMILLKNHNITPKAFIHVWPESRRTLEIDSNDTVATGGPWNNYRLPKEVPYEKVFYSHRTHIHAFSFNIMNANLLANSTPIIHASFHVDNVKLQPKELGVTLLPTVDKARDNRHPGIASYESAADILNRKITRLLK